MSASFIWAVAGVHWCSLKCVGRKPPPEFLRARGTSPPSSTNVLLLFSFLASRRASWVQTGFSFLRLCPRRWYQLFAVLNCSLLPGVDSSLSLPGLMVMLSVQGLQYTLFSEVFKACPPKPFRPHGCHPPHSPFLPTAHSKKVKPSPCQYIHIIYNSMKNENKIKWNAYAIPMFLYLSFCSPWLEHTLSRPYAHQSLDHSSRTMSIFSPALVSSGRLDSSATRQSCAS